MIFNLILPVLWNVLVSQARTNYMRAIIIIISITVIIRGLPPTVQFIVLAFSFLLSEGERSRYWQTVDQVTRANTSTEHFHKPFVRLSL